jgi:glycerol-3-phosphate acyltransferase PlsY
VTPVLLIIAAYVLGSLSPAYALCRMLRGRDLRTIDSGNLGARNAGRVLGTWAGVVVLVLDAAKGYAAVALAVAAGAPQWVVMVCGAASVAGHNWPLYLGFRGGRGAATVAGATLALLPIEMGLGLLACFVILKTTGSLYIGGLVAVVLSIVLALSLGGSGVLPWSPALFSVPLILRHLPDISLHVRQRRGRIP